MRCPGAIAGRSLFAEAAEALRVAAKNVEPIGDEWA
jgi:hypothetical protein